MELDLLFGNSLQPGELGAAEKNGAHRPGAQAPRHTGRECRGLGAPSQLLPSRI